MTFCAWVPHCLLVYRGKPQPDEARDDSATQSLLEPGYAGEDPQKMLQRMEETVQAHRQGRQVQKGESQKHQQNTYGTPGGNSAPASERVLQATAALADAFATPATSTDLSKLPPALRQRLAK
eukprot:scaffold4954_cov202-Prasinococcus_capsulatus_cf.AAC.1